MTLRRWRPRQSRLGVDTGRRATASPPGPAALSKLFAVEHGRTLPGRLLQFVQYPLRVLVVVEAVEILEEGTHHRHRIHQSVDWSGSVDWSDRRAALNVQRAIPGRFRFPHVHWNDGWPSDNQLPAVPVLVAPDVLGDHVINLVEHRPPVRPHRPLLPAAYKLPLQHQVHLRHGLAHPVAPLRCRLYKRHPVSFQPSHGNADDAPRSRRGPDALRVPASEPPKSATADAVRLRHPDVAGWRLHLGPQDA